MPDQQDLPEGVERWRADGFRMKRVGPSSRSRHPDTYVRSSDLPAIRAAAVEEERERIKRTLLERLAERLPNPSAFPSDRDAAVREIHAYFAEQGEG